MGDRTYISITVRKSDRAVVDEAFGPEDEMDNRDGSITLSLCDSSPSEIQDLMDFEIPFTFYHATGCNYPPHIGAFDGKKFDEWQANEDGVAVLEVDHETWSIPGGVLRGLKAFGRHYDKVERLVKA